MNVLDHLSKQSKDGGRSDPTSVTDLSSIIMDYCIGTYERKTKQDVYNSSLRTMQETEKDSNQGNEQHDSLETKKGNKDNSMQELSLRQIFSHHINQIVRQTQKDSTNIYTNY